MNILGFEVETKAELRAERDLYREALRKLARENYNAQRDLDIARGELLEHQRSTSNTEDFLAVLQGDQVAEHPPTEPN